MEFAIFVIPVFLLLAILIRLGAGSLDHDRVRRYITERGGKVLHAGWTPFGPGWFGEKSDRIYKVRYLDKDGNEHHAHCKTSALSGVYFTKDEIVRYAERPEEPRGESLEEENRRLREEIERLKRGGV